MKLYIILSYLLVAFVQYMQLQVEGKLSYKDLLILIIAPVTTIAIFITLLAKQLVDLDSTWIKKKINKKNYDK